MLPASWPSHPAVPGATQLPPHPLHPHPPPPCTHHPHPETPAPAGLLNYIISLAAVLYFGFYKQSLPLDWVYDNYVPLITASIIFSAALSLYLYASRCASRTAWPCLALADASTAATCRAGRSPLGG